MLVLTICIVLDALRVAQTHNVTPYRSSSDAEARAAYCTSSNRRLVLATAAQLCLGRASAASAADWLPSQQSNLLG
jgi:hypothetical protein